MSHEDAAPVPEDLRRFIYAHVPSVPFVEALLVYQSNPGPVPLEDVARRLYIDTRQSAHIVEQLRAAGIVEADAAAGHRYAPTADVRPFVDLLVRYYRTHLVEVTSLIHSRTGRMAQQFADAFKIRKE